MTINQLLEQIQGYVQVLKNTMTENEDLKKQVESLNIHVATLEAQVADLSKQVDTLEAQANLNFAKAQEIVEELKVMINAK